MLLNSDENLFGLKHFVFGEDGGANMYCIPGICLNYEMFTKTYDVSGVSWINFFVQQGFRVHILDWQNFIPPQEKHFGEFLSETISEIITEETKDVVLVTHSTSGAFGWKIAEINPLVKKIIALAPAPPGNIQKIFESNLKENIIVFKSGEYTYHIHKQKGFIPDKLWVEEKLVAHASKFPQEKIQNLYETCKSCDPRAILERFNTNGSQVKIREDAIKTRGDLEVFVVTGDFDPPHPYETDNVIVTYFNNLGIKSEFIWLADFEIKGHGHMFMMENDSVVICKLVYEKVFPKIKDMGIKTSESFSGKSESLAVIKTYKDSVPIIEKVIAEKLSTNGIVTSFGRLGDFGSFSGEFLSNLKKELSEKGIYFSHTTALDINKGALEKNISADEKIITDITNIPVAENYFDVSIARYVLQWNSLERQEKIINEMVRTTKGFGVIQHPMVDISGQKKFHELFEGNILPAMKRHESYYSIQQEIENIFDENKITYELVDMERIDNISDVFIERYNLSQKEAEILKSFLGKDDYWNRTTWMIFKK